MIKKPDVYNLLTSLNLPVFIQGDMPEDMPYPDTFITYLWYTSADIWRFDNRAIATDYTVQINIYSRFPDQIDITLEKLIDTLLASGYSKSDCGRMIPSDEATHLGWTIDVNYIVKE